VPGACLPFDGRGGSVRSPPPPPLESGVAKTASRALDELSAESSDIDGPPLLMVGVGLDREWEKQVT